MSAGPGRPTLPDPLSWIAKVIDREAYDDAAWFDDKCNATSVAFLEDLRSERQSKAERKAAKAYADLKRSGLEIVSQAEIAALHAEIQFLRGGKQKGKGAL